jgi:hypothetical protein
MTDGIPVTIEGYQRLNTIVASCFGQKPFKQVLFGEEGTTIQVRSPSEAAELIAPLRL